MRLLPFLAATLATATAATTAVLPYQDPRAPLETRVADLVARLTPDEKLALVNGTGFTTKPIPRLGIPAMVMVDAGQGVRGGMKEMMGPATAFPSGVAMASSWDPGLVEKIGQAIGTEARNKGVGAQVLLGPAVNIHRSPLGGRNGEYFSEDPFLAGRLAVGYVQGMQSTGVAACVKHYACNNEEADRDFVDVRVGERALREIYLPAFEAAVREGRAWTLMSSYNQVGGLHASANPYLLTAILRHDWGFDGAVISDWGAVHGAESLAAGDDIEMPGPKGFLAADKAAAALRNGKITQAQVDEADRRIVRTLIRTGLLDGPLPKPDAAQVDSPEHRLLAYTAATEGMVLLKNDGALLPFDRAKLHTLAVVGPAAKSMQLGADGSPRVEPAYSVGPAEGIARHAGPGVAVTAVETVLTGEAIPASAFATPDNPPRPGLRAEIFPNRSLQGPPALVRVDPGIDATWDQALPPAPGVGPNEFSVRWTGTLDAPEAGHYGFTLVADDGCRLIVDGKPVIDHWVESGPVPVTGDAELAKGRHTVEADYFQAKGGACMRLSWRTPDKPPFAAEIAAAKAANAVVICVTTRGTEGEGHDRPSMALPYHQDDLIRAVLAANPRAVVALNNGTPVDARAWLAQTPAVLEAWFPGQEGGNALGALLFGDASPSGRLPDTFGVKRDDYPDVADFPGTKGTVRYAEGIYVGYRAFDRKGIAPAFPFGHGLAYTTFAYGKPVLSAPELQPDGTAHVSLPVTNTGKRPGVEVVQLYVSSPEAKIDRPVRELKGFARVALAPGETKNAEFDLAPRALAYFDVPGKQWKADPGLYRIDLGASSRDLRQNVPLRLVAPFTEAVPSSRPDMTGITP